MHFYLNEDVKSKQFFQELTDYIGESEVSFYEITALNTVLEGFGVLSYNKYYRKDSNLEDIILVDSNNKTIPYIEIKANFSKWLAFMTFHYPGIKNRFFEYNEEGFNHHYYSLLSFYLSNLLGLQSAINEALLKNRNFMDSSHGIKVLKSMKDLWSITLDCFTDIVGIRNLCSLYFNTCQSFGFHILSDFSDLKYILPYHIDYLKELEGENFTSHPLAYMDRLEIFKLWYDNEKVVPYSRQILTLYEEETKEIALPLILQNSPFIPKKEIPKEALEPKGDSITDDTTVIQATINKPRRGRPPKKVLEKEEKPLEVIINNMNPLEGFSKDKPLSFLEELALGKQGLS
jgi:hypothetical protein